MYTFFYVRQIRRKYKDLLCFQYSVLSQIMTRLRLRKTMKQKNIFEQFSIYKFHGEISF